ncbi:unnamed protein product [Calypogeia fissa]
MLIDVSHLVTPEERRVFLDEPVPQNGVTLGGARISEVTSLAKVLLEELVVAQGDQVMARSELTPLRFEHDKVMKQNKAFKAQLEDLRGRLQGIQLEMQKLQEEKNIIESTRQDLTEKQGELIMKHQSDRKEWEAQVEKLAITREREISSAKRKEEMDKLKFDSKIATEISKARLMYDDLLWWKGKYEAAKVSDGTSIAMLQDEEEMVAMKELAQLKTQMQQLKDKNYHAFNKMLELCPPEDDERDMVLVDKTVYDLILGKYRRCESELRSLTALASSLMDDNDLLIERDQDRNEAVIHTGFAAREIWQNLPRILDKDKGDTMAQEHQIGQILLRILCCLQGVNPQAIKKEDIAQLWNYIPDRCKPMLPEFHMWGQVAFDDVNEVYSCLLGKAYSRAASILLAAFAYVEDKQGHTNPEVDEEVDPPNEKTMWDLCNLIYPRIHGLVHVILQDWANKEIKKDRGKWTVPKLLSFLEEGGWEKHFST